MNQKNPLPCLPNTYAWLASHGVTEVASLLLLLEGAEKLVVQKKHRLVSEGRLEGHAFFIERGMTRSYWVVDGNEVTTSFSTEGSIVFSMDEVYYGLPSEEYVETVEEVEAWAVELPALREAVRTDKAIAEWWVRIHQDEYRRLHRSHKERLTLPARQRLEEFARQFPEVCRRGRLSDIASYLGITPSTLSRLRAGKE